MGKLRALPYHPQDTGALKVWKNETKVGLLTVYVVVCRSKPNHGGPIYLNGICEFHLVENRPIRNFPVSGCFDSMPPPSLHLASLPRVGHAWPHGLPAVCSLACGPLLSFPALPFAHLFLVLLVSAWPRCSWRPYTNPHWIMLALQFYMMCFFFMALVTTFIKNLPYFLDVLSVSTASYQCCESRGMSLFFALCSGPLCACPEYVLKYLFKGGKKMLEAPREDFGFSNCKRSSSKMVLHDPHLLVSMSCVILSLWAWTGPSDSFLTSRMW